MEHTHVKVRAIIFDVYGTLLQLRGAPDDADARWNQLFKDILGRTPPFSRSEFSAHTRQIINRQHAAARVRGIQWPEILWPSIVTEALPGLAKLSEENIDEFIFRQMQLERTPRVADGASECLHELSRSGKLLGIASNAQAYTLRELDEALLGAGSNLSNFDRGLCFWSFRHGFSKPDPHVFQILTARLEARGIQPGEILMVGDRLDNDIEPARAHGWQTYHVTARNKDESGRGGAFREIMARCDAMGA